MNGSTDWTTALAVLGAGLVLGVVVFFVARRRNAATPAREHPVLRGFVWGVACTLIAGGIAYYGSTFAKSKSDVAHATATANGDVTEDLKQLEAAVRSDPKNLEQRIALAKAYFSRNDLMASFEQSKAALAIRPDEPRALTYNAVVRMAMGEADQARTMLELATQRDPKFLDAWVALASARTQSGDARGAAAAINAAIAQYPDEEPRLRSVFAEIQKHAPAATGADSAPNAERASLPPDHPPMPGMTARATPEPATIANDAPPIRITLAMDPAANVKSGVVYVIARGTTAGHPVAVRRIDVASFPVSLELGAADAMMGQSLPASVRLEARLDADGDAGTKDPSDPHAAADNVAAGASVALTLTRAN